jgi:hypothetical protein
MAQGRKLVWASLLAVGLWQFVLLGFFDGSQWTSTTLWGRYVLPWLQRLGMTAPIVVAGIVTGCVLRPRRPEPLAALIGAAAALPIALPMVLPETFRSALFQFLFGGGSRAMEHLGLPEHFWWRQLVSSTRLLFLMFWIAGLPAAVAGWVGARYWRAGSWGRFWKGPGGAIVRGGLVVGALGLVLELVRWEAVLRPTARAMAGEGDVVGGPVRVSQVIVLNLSAVAYGAMVTALLVGWRPRPTWGAFAGSGTALALFGLSLLDIIVSGSAALGPVHLLDAVAVSAAVVRMLEGAAAGAFAGDWEDDGET